MIALTVAPSAIPVDPDPIAPPTRSSGLVAETDPSDRHRQWLHSLPQLLWGVDRHGQGQSWNAAWAAYTGQSVALPDSAAWLDWVHPDDREQVVLPWQTPLLCPIDHRVDLRLRRGDQTYRWFSLEWSPIYDPAGQIQDWVGVFSDIDRFKATEATLANQESFLKAVLTNLAEGIVACDANGQLTLFNPAAQAFHELPSQPLPAESWAEYYSLYRVDRDELVPPDEIPLARAFRGEVVQNAELRIISKSGVERLLVSNGRPILHHETGAQLGAVVAMQDVTAQKLAEAELLSLNRALEERVQHRTAQLEAANRLKDELLTEMEQQRLRFCRVLEKAPALMCFLKGDLHIHEFANAYYVNLTGMTSVLGLPIEVVWPGWQRQGFVALLNQVYHTGEPFIGNEVSIEVEPHHGRAAYKGYFNFIFLPTHNAQGDVDGMFIHAVDVTEQVHARDRLRQTIEILGQQQQQLRSLQRLTNLLNHQLTDLPGLLQTVADAAYHSIAEADFSLIGLWNSAQQQLEVAAQAGNLPADFSLMSGWAASHELIEQVFATGSPKLRQHLDGQPSTLYAVPIASAQAGHLGILAIGSWTHGEAFAVDDQCILLAFGEQVAIAVSNAQLISTLEEREERLALQNDLLARQNQELEHQQHQIQQQNLQLQEAARLKSQFLATMSHELRTPMNAIIGFSQLLLRPQPEALSGLQADMVTRIFNNGKNLLALINDILDLSTIEAGRLTLKVESFDVVHLAQSTVAELRSLAAEKNLHIQVQSYLTQPQIINDRQRLQQILVNLLSNAIKFTEAGDITITLADHTPTELRISVADTGIGIAPQNIDVIFQEFRQLDQSTTRRYAGTGLGLAIVAWLVHRMHGTIHVDSTVGVGSTFTLTLPCCVPSTQPEPFRFPSRSA